MLSFCSLCMFSSAYNDHYDTDDDDDDDGDL